VEEVVELGLRNWEAGRGGVGCGLVSEPEVVRQGEVVVQAVVSDMADQYPFWS
jgi:hypothetical protein